MKMKEEKAQDFKRMYSNSIGLKMTNIDFNMQVSYKEDKNIEHLCDIIMSPEQAKFTKMMLEQAIEQYENMYRTIIIPSNVTITKTEGENNDGGKQ